MKIVRCPKCNTRYKEIYDGSIKLPILCQCGFEITEECFATVIKSKLDEAMVLLDSIEDSIDDNEY